MHTKNRYWQTTTCLTAVLLVMGAPGVALANPVGGTVSAGGAVISSSGNKTSITQTSDRAVIDWHGFDIGAGETTQFYQPSSSSVTLNRVGGSGPSVIDGQLLANGNIFIINPNGVLFGAHSHVDVNGLVASTADVSNANFMAGKFILDIAGNPNASVINRGTITAKEAGLVGLVAPNVVNSGIITARLGRVHLASGDTATVDLYGDGLLEVAVSDKVKSQLVSNTGIISADGGTIALTAAAGRTVVNSVVTVSGELSAMSVGSRNGRIIIAAEGSNAVSNNIAANKGKKTGSSTVTIAGLLDVSGKGTGETGGSISITGDALTVKAGSLLDASGANGGGTILIGGDEHGAGTLGASLTTVLEQGATITADALVNGNGGKVILWSDGRTEFAGSISAKGGVFGGLGGFTETSGHDQLKVTGTVNLTSADGNAGTWLLDPTNISILQSSATSDGVNSFTTTDIQNMSSSADVSLLADNSITIDINGQGINLGTNHSLTLTATSGNITSLSGGNISATGTGNITLNAGGTIDTSNLTLFSSNTVSTTSVGATTLGNINATNVTATVTGTGNKLTTNAISTGTGGTISLTADDMDLNGNLSGTGTLSIQERTTTRNIALNTGTDDGSGLYLSTAEIGRMMDGWSSIVIGNASTNAVTSYGNTSYTWTDPLTLAAKSLNVGSLVGSGNAAFTINPSTGTVNYANITTAGGAITINGNSTFSNTATHTLTSNGGNITLTGNVTGNSTGQHYVLTLNAGSGNISLGTVNGVSGNALGFDLTATGNGITLNGALGGTLGLGVVTLNSTVSLTLPAITASNVSATVTGAGNKITTGAITTGAGGNITLTADDVTIGGDLSGTGTLTLQPYSTSRVVCVNYSSGACASNNFSLDSGELSHLIDGWSAIKIDKSTNVSTLYLGATNWSDPTTFIEGNVVNVMGAITASDNGNLSFSTGNWTNLSANITTTTQSVTTGQLVLSGGNIATSGGAVSMGALTAANNNFSVTTGGGNISFTTVSDLYASNGKLFNFDAGTGNVTASANVNTTADVTLNGTALTLSGVWGGSTAVGNVNLTAMNALTLPAITTQAGKTVNATVTGAGNKLTANAIATGVGGNITLAADDLDMLGALSGTGTITLQPNATTRVVHINLGSDDGSSFYLSTTELARLTNGWSQINIGRTNGSQIGFGAATTWQDPVNFRTGATSVNSILAYYNITGTDDASLTFTSPGGIDMRNAIISTLGKDITFNSGLSTFVSTINSQGGNISVTGTENFNGAPGASSMNSGNGNITISGLWTGTAGQSMTLTAGTGTIALNNTINGAFDLTATGATITASSAWGGTTALGNVNLTSANSITLPAVTASTLTVTTTGAAADIITGSSSFITVTGSGAALTFTSGHDITTGRNVTASNATGNVLFKAVNSISNYGISAQNGTVTFDADSDANQVGAVSSLGSISTVGGNITIGGGLNPLTDYAYGVGTGIGINEGGSTVASTSGNIVFNGHSGTTGGNGIQFYPGGNVHTGGVGTITLNGIGYNGGIVLDLAATIYTNSGAINLTGTSTNTGTGGITVGRGPSIYSTSGDINLTGINNGTGANQYGISFGNLTSGTSAYSGSGKLTITGSAAGSAADIAMISTGTEAFGNGTTQSGDIVFVADKVDFSNPFSIQTTGNVIFKTRTAGATIGVNGGVGNLQVTTNILSHILASNVTIGRSDSTGLMRVLGGDLSATNYNLSLLNGNNNIEFDGGATALTLGANKNFTETTSGAGVFLTYTNAGTITTSGTGNINLNSAVILGSNLSLNTGAAGTLTFASTVDSLATLTSLQAMLVGGGGGGGWGLGGGGGAGGVDVFSRNVSAGDTTTVTVGNGGAGGTNASQQGATGSSTTAFGATATGGGGGGYYSGTNGTGGGSGGGAGAGANGVTPSGGASTGNSLGTGNTASSTYIVSGANGTGTYGNAGGSITDGRQGSGLTDGAGGGGAGAPGGGGVSAGTYAGGNGIQSNISGTNYYYGGGGGGGTLITATGGAGGLGGGGGAGSEHGAGGAGGTGGLNAGGTAASGVGGNGGANTGGGGGGGYWGGAPGNGGTGGSGVAYVRYTGNAGQVSVTNGSATTVGGDTVYAFTGGSSSVSILSGCAGGCGLTANAGTITATGAMGGTTALGNVSLTSVNSLTLPTISAATISATTTGATADINVAHSLAASATGAAISLTAGRDLLDSTSGANISASNATGNVLLKAANNISWTPTAATSITTNGGSITLDSDSDANNAGAIGFTKTTLTSNGGAITLGGGTNPATGYAWSASGDGINLTNSTVNAGGGNISMLAQTNGSTHGLAVNTSTLSTTGTGTISLTGYSNGATTGEGVSIYGASAVNAQAGQVTITGYGGTGSGTSNTGVSLFAPITTTTGNIVVTGTSRGTNAAGTYGIRLSANAASTSGNITLTGISNGIGDAGIYTTGASSIGNGSTTGNITYITDTLSLPSSLTTTTTGNVTFQTYSANGTIGVAGAPGTLQLTSGLLNAVTANNLIIGRSDGTGLMRVSGADLSARNYNLSLLNGTGNIQYDGGATALTLVANKNFTETTSTGLFTTATNAGTITTSGTGSQTYNSAISLGANFTSNTGATGTDTFNSTINGASDFTANAGTITDTNAIGGTTPVGNVNLTSVNALTLPSITTVAGKTVNATVTGAGNKLTANAIATGAAGNITLTADDLDLLGNVSGTGNLLIKTNDTTRTINVNKNSDNGTSLYISTADIAGMVDGWNQITIGTSSYAVQQVNVGTSTWNDKVAFLSNNTMTIGGTYTGLGDAGFTFTAIGLIGANNTTITTQGGNVALSSIVPGGTFNVTTQGGTFTAGSIFYNSSAVSFQVDTGNGNQNWGLINSTHNGSLTTSAGTGTINFNGTINGTDLTASGGTIAATSAWGGTIAMGNVALTTINSLTLPSITATSITATTTGAAADLIVANPLTASAAGAAITLAAGHDLLDSTNNANLSASNATGNILLKAVNNINWSPATAASITTAGGSITLDSDSDASQVGEISLKKTTINSNGGNIVMGGGTNPLTGSAYDAGLTTFVAGANVNWQAGILIDASSILAGAGNITMNGHGAVVASGSQPTSGININNSTIQTTSGATTLTGTGGAGNQFDHGILLSNATQVSTTSGATTLTGTGGTGTAGGHSGVFVYNASSVTSAGSGTITFNGTGGSGGTNDNGITVGGTQTTIGGSSDAGNITFNGDNVTFAAGHVIQTTGTVYFKPLSVGGTTGVAGAPGTLQITATILNSVNAPNLVIGRSDGIGLIRVNGVDLSARTYNLALINGSGNIQYDGGATALTMAANKNFTETTSNGGSFVTATNAGTITTSGTGNITFNGPLLLGSDFSLNTGAAGTVTFNGTVDNLATLTDLQAFLVGGGGGGGGFVGGGGGGGGVVVFDRTVSGGDSTTVTVGAGGASGGYNANGSNGGNTTAFGAVAAGGGGGGESLATIPGLNGGSGGGAGTDFNNPTTPAGGIATGSSLGAGNTASSTYIVAGANGSGIYGNNGGALTTVNTGGSQFSAGGGGAGTAGQGGPAGVSPYNGGDGIQTSITGSNLYFAGGGGGGGHFGAPGGNGGLGGGGGGGSIASIGGLGGAGGLNAGQDGATNSFSIGHTNSGNGGTNTGGGGGGTNTFGGSGGVGGSGIAVIRYTGVQAQTTVTGATVTGLNGDTLLTYPSNGSVTVNSFTPSNLTVNAGTINANAAIGSKTGLGNVTFTSANALTLPSITTAAGKTVNATVTGAGLKLTANAITTGAAGNINLTADDVDLLGTVSGTGTLSIQSNATNRIVRINNGSDNGSGLYLSTAEIGRMANGWGQINIGRSDDNADMFIGTSSFMDPINFRNGARETIVTGQTITGTDDASVTFSGNGWVDAYGNVVTNGRDVNFSIVNSAGGPVPGYTFYDYGTNITTHGGNITMAGKSGIGTSGGNFAFTTSGGNITFNGDLTSLYGSGIGRTATFDAGTGTLAFNGKLDNGANYVMNANTITTAGAWGSVTPLGNVTLTTVNNLTLPAATTQAGKTFAATVTGGKLTTNGIAVGAAGNITITALDLDILGDLTGTGVLTMQSPNRIRLNYLGGWFYLDATELAHIKDGWSNIVFNATGSFPDNYIQLGDTSWTDPVSFNAFATQNYGVFTGTDNTSVGGSGFFDVLNTMTIGTGTMNFTGFQLSMQSDAALTANGGTIITAGINGNGHTLILNGGTLNITQALSNNLAGVTLTSANALTLPAITTNAGGTVNVTVNGGNLLTTSSIATGTGGNITLTSGTIAIGGNLSGTGTLSLVDNNSYYAYVNMAPPDSTYYSLDTASLGHLTAGWNLLNITAPGIVEMGATNWTSPLSVNSAFTQLFGNLTSSQNVTFNGQAFEGRGGNVTTTGGHDIYFALSNGMTAYSNFTATSNGGNITINPVLNNSGGNITLNSGGGNITLNALGELSSGVGLTDTFDAGTGTVAIGGSVNTAADVTVKGQAITTNGVWGASKALGNVILTSINSLTLQSITAKSILAQVTGGTSDLVLASGTTLTASGTGNAITLVTPHNFINNSNASALNLTGGGRWLIYATDPTDNQLSGLSSNFNRYSCAYNSPGTCQASAALGGATVTIVGTGNGLIYSYTPTLTATANDANVTYGDAANLTGYGYTITGYLASDTADTVSGSLNGSSTYVQGSNVGDYAINYSSGSLASALGYKVTYANNATGLHVLKRVLTTGLTGTVEKTYDGTAIATLSGSNYTIGNIYNGDNVSIATTLGAYNDKNAGTGKTVTVTGLTLTGSAMNNYTLASTTTSGAVGQVDQRTLTITAIGNDKVYNGNTTGSVNLIDNRVAGDAFTTETYGSALFADANAGTGKTVTVTGIAITGGDAANYIFNTSTSTTATISKKTLDVTVGNEGITYGDIVPTNPGYSYNGFAGSDTAAVITVAPVVNSGVSGMVDAGSYLGNYTATGGVAANYAFNYIPGNLTVSKRVLNVTADNQAVNYGTVTPGATFTYNGFVGSDNASVLDVAPTGQSVLTVGGIANAGVYAGNYSVSGGSDNNYDFHYVSGGFSINQVGINVTVAGQTVTYGHVTPGSSYVYSGFVNGDTAATAILSDPTISSTISGVANAGTYTGNYNASGGATNTNYFFNYIAGDLTVTKATLNVVADNQTVTYGTNVPGGTFHYTGFVNGDTASVIDHGALITSDNTGIVDAGTYANNYKVSGATDNNYDFVYSSGNLNVSKKNITVAANNETIGYGTGNVLNGYTATGLVGGQTINSVDLATNATSSTSGNWNVRATPWTITATNAVGGNGFNANNYTVSYTNGTLTIIPKALTVTATSGGKVYDGTNIQTGVALSDNRVTGDILSDSYSSATYVNKNAGVGKTLTVTGVAVSGTDSANYTYNSTAVTSATITPYTLTVTANAGQGKIYGDANSALGYTTNALVSGDTSSVFSGGLSRAAGENVGNYLIGLGTLSAGGNYTLVLNGTPTNFSITPRDLTVTANNQNKIYAGADPALTYGYGTLYNGDTASILTGDLTRVAGENVGTYAITQGTLSAGGNYIIHYNPGTMTINAAALDLSIIANPESKYYGAADPTFAFSHSALLNGDTDSIFTGALARAMGEGVGTYAINIGTLSAGQNYIIHYTGNYLTILARPSDVAHVTIPDSVLRSAQNVSLNGDDDTIIGAPSAITKAQLGGFFGFRDMDHEFSLHTMSYIHLSPALLKLLGKSDPSI